MTLCSHKTVNSLNTRGGTVIPSTTEGNDSISSRKLRTREAGKRSVSGNPFELEATREGVRTNCDGVRATEDRVSRSCVLELELNSSGSNRPITGLNQVSTCSAVDSGALEGSGLSVTRKLDAVITTAKSDEA